MNSFRKSFFISLIVALPFIGLVLAPKSGLLELIWTETEQPINVVRVTTDDGETRSGGSGCLIRGNMILTAEHVVRDFLPGDELSIEFRDGLIRSGSIIKIDPVWDLAAIRIDPVLYPVARPAAKAAIKDQTVNICGFAEGEDYHTIRGRVSGFRSPTRKHPDYWFVINKPGIEGMSGGPVFNDGGEVVGIMFGSRFYAHCTGLEAIKDFLKDLQ